MANQFPKNAGGQVSKADAEKWIEKFAKERKKDTSSVFYGKDVFDAIFKDPTVTGISFLFCRKPKKDGIDADDLVLVGTREDGTLVWTNDPPNSSLMEGSGSGTYENGVLCPSQCPTP